ncbi:MAG: DUF1385 domain-containing protein [Clostridia bacterium]|nr:DUF1385 domain-containing protein [Clostridia bacterium]
MSKEKKTSIGGQALMEGILMRGPEKSAIVVRKPDKTLEIKEEPIGSNSHKAFWKLPFIRGPVMFWDSMKQGVSALMYSAEFFEVEGEETEPGRFEKWVERKIGMEKFEKIMMTFTVILGIAMPIGLFILLPTLLAGFFGEMHFMLRNLLEGAIRILIFIGFVWSTSLMKEIKRTYMYHGAEHKTIACYEKGMELTVENVRQCCRFHPRCGTSFLFVVMIISILVFSVVQWSNPLVRMLLRLALLPVVAGISYEINRFAGRYDNWFTKILRAPGVAMQRITTKEPDDSMIEVAIEALSRVIPEDKEKDRW